MSVPEILRCTTCSVETSIASVPSTCPECRGILDLRLAAPKEGITAEEAEGIWRWAKHLPHCDPTNRVTLGEGKSPLLSAPRMAEQTGLTDLWIKNDSIMPTGSFKDRAIALATSLARHYGRPGLVLSSSGNAGASSAAYAARAGLPLVVFVPATAPEAKLRQIAATGARLVPIDGNTADCCRLADRLSREKGWVNLTTTYHNPYGVDAYATIAYEIAELDPDVILLPISSGPLLAGIMKGYCRLMDAGKITRMPRPIAVQAEACAPIARAFACNGDIEPWPRRPTIASALNDTLEGYERDGDYTLYWIRRHDGAAFAVDDDAIRAGTRLLATTEGILVEPSAAVPVAAISRLLERGLMLPDERVVAVTTGHGLKDMSWANLSADRAGFPADVDLGAIADKVQLARSDGSYQ
ncbi:pyridoxal-phosphate dependent enzyme [Chelativorans sp. YIM 93263]|uniref:pyridoxal-phosphate dependent enzyme n=1 Tax=Chelativorans sp. YIM 93263 TaxID=2906648 RepID=UPI002378A208|nr:pyridoxal-phosphate dependent enzyme [Chelativorans sp. YIM 93263]